MHKHISPITVPLLMLIIFFCYPAWAMKQQSLNNSKTSTLIKKTDLIIDITLIPKPMTLLIIEYASSLLPTTIAILDRYNSRYKRRPLYQ